MNDFNHDYEQELHYHPENFEIEEERDDTTCDFCRGVVNVETLVCTVCNAKKYYV